MDWYIPLIIVAARLCDVSIGTVRMILVIGGHRWIAASLGFIEVIIWAVAVGNVVKYLDNPIALVAYGGGFSLGTLIGMWIEDRIAIGYRLVRVMNPVRELDVSASLRERGWRVTRVPGEGRDGPVEIAFAVVRRRELRRLVAEIDDVAPAAFVTVERADRASGSTFTSVRGQKPGSSVRK